MVLPRRRLSWSDQKDVMEPIKQDLTTERCQQLESMCKGPEAGLSLAHTGGSVRRRVCLAQGEPGEGWWEVNVERGPGSEHKALLSGRAQELVWGSLHGPLVWELDPCFVSHQASSQRGVQPPGSHHGSFREEQVINLNSFSLY